MLCIHMTSLTILLPFTAKTAVKEDYYPILLTPLKLSNPQNEQTLALSNKSHAESQNKSPNAVLMRSPPAGS